MTAAWGARWCHREKGDGVRSRFLVKQFNDAKQGDFFTYTPRAEAMRILLTAATLLRHTTTTTDFSVAITYTPVKEGHEILVQAPPEYGAEGMVWRLRRSLYGLREAAQRFQEFLRPHCTRSRGHTQRDRTRTLPTVLRQNPAHNHVQTGLDAPTQRAWQTSQQSVGRRQEMSQSTC